MSKRKVIVPKSMKANYESLHFAPAVAHGKRLYCSGQIGSGADGSVSEEPTEQFVQAWENVKTVLEAGGSSLEKILEITTFHVGFNDHIGAFMAVRDKYVPSPYPAWTAVGVSELAFGALAEIKVVAAR